jgi:hypothetical protein
MSNSIRQQFNSDWVMVGFRYENGMYAIAASRELTHSELESRTSTEHLYSAESYDPYVLTTSVLTVTFKMNKYVVVVGNSYRDVLDTLIRDWWSDPVDSPDPDSPQQVATQFGVVPVRE